MEKIGYKFGYKILKAILFVIISSCILSASLYFVDSDRGSWGYNLYFVYGVIPASIIASILFLILDYFFMKNRTVSVILYILRGTFLIILFLVVLLIMMRRGDVLFYFFHQTEAVLYADNTIMNI